MGSPELKTPYLKFVHSLRWNFLDLVCMNMSVKVTYLHELETLIDPSRQ
jgi:hypothetical protein